MQQFQVRFLFHDHVIAVCMASVFLRTDIILMLIRYAAHIDSMTACFAFIDITFLWSYAVIFQLIHTLFQEQTQTKSRKFRQFRILSRHPFYRYSSIRIDFPDCIDIHESLYCDCKKCHLTVDFTRHRSLHTRGVGSLLSDDTFAFCHSTDNPIVVRRRPPYIHFHWSIQ